MLTPTKSPNLRVLHNGDAPPRTPFGETLLMYLWERCGGGSKSSQWKWVGSNEVVGHFAPKVPRKDWASCKLVEQIRGAMAQLVDDGEAETCRGRIRPTK
eukprot:TRINITY_DN22301_c0_g4_i2.p1 TRINITY_DN22301_c0_g4~~TRINITY_DN22301_c0_g4_i2.p1  ORF type:complete len:100 (-),score=9.01 TRINITY_DN22301_c0_g4_i2:153-452(-)